MANASMSSTYGSYHFTYFRATSRSHSHGLLRSTNSTHRGSHFTADGY